LSSPGPGRTRRRPRRSTRRLGLCINLEENDEDAAGPSQWSIGDGSQGCSTWAAKDDPPSDADDDEGTDYDVFYELVGMH
jgi:hypothetical protein